MKFFVTKYALTAGIQEVEGYMKNGYLYCILPGSKTTNIFPKAQFHASYELAYKAAEATRMKKISSLESQAGKLKKLKFRVPSPY